MPDHYVRASARTNRHARQLLRTGVPAVVAADALLTSALALWAAHTGRHADVVAQLQRHRNPIMI